MAILALSAPTTAISNAPGGGTIGNATLPAAEASSTSGFTGASVPNNGAVLVRVTCTTAGSFQCQIQRTVEGATYPATTIQVASLAAGSYVFGPFSRNDFNDVNGLLQMTGTFFGGASNNIGVYTLPGAAA